MIFTNLLVVGLIVRPQSARINLDAWFRKDSKGQSCASCHSVDGIELRAFHDSDINRRTNRHHSGAVVDDIFKVIRSYPSSYPSSYPASIEATELRPLQPGQNVLPGNSPVIRDRAFLLNLKATHPELLQPVTDIQTAQSLQRNYLAIDLRSVQIGIPLNRLSEDGFHGKDHQTIANWIPDVVSFDSDELRPELETYYASPTEANLDAIDRKVVSLYKGIDPFSGLSLAKYRSLLVYQHELRTGKPMSYMPKDNPFWQVAEFGRINVEGEPSIVQVPPDVLSAKNMNTTFRQQMKDLRLPWFWLGWIKDPSLTKSGPSKETNRAEYFCRYLEEDGPYIGHEIFMLSRKLSEQSRQPLYPGIPFEIQYSFLLANTPLVDREPKDPDAKQVFRKICVNSFRMTLWLLEADLKKTNKAIRKIPQANQLKFMRQYFVDIKDPSTALVDRVQKRLFAATGT